MLFGFHLKQNFSSYQTFLKLDPVDFSLSSDRGYVILLSKNNSSSQVVVHSVVC